MPQQRILLGVIGRPHGVRGLVRVTSHTADPTDLTAYGPLSDDRGRRFVLRWCGEGIAEITQHVDGASVKVADRTAAEKLTNTPLYVDRAQLPEPEDAEEFYLADLVGMTALDANGAVLGTVATVHDYGAGASLEVVRDGVPAVLVPFTHACVPEVDVANGRVVVEVPVNLSHEVREAEARSAEGEGDRVGTLQADAACRPDHPHPRRFAPSTSPAPAGEVARAQRGRGARA